MTLESQGRWKILVQLGGDKRKTRIPIIFWEKSMSNETKLYENLKKEAVYIAHWQDLRHSLIRKREKNKLGTSYKKKSKSTMVGQVETTYLADKKANQCAAQCCFSFSSFINLTEHFAGRIKAADRWSHPSRGIPSFLAVLYCLFFQLGTRAQGQQLPVPGLGGLCKDRKVSCTLCLNQSCCHLNEKAVVLFIVHLYIFPTCKINIPFIRGIQIQQHTPGDYLENYLKWQTAVLKPSLCAFTLLSLQSDHTHQITRLSTEQ